MTPLRRLLTAASALALPAVVAAVPSAHAAVPPEHAVVTCQTASFYANYDSANGPSGFLRTLTLGNKIGHTPGVHPVYNGWAASFDYGPNDWGYLRIECIGGYDSW
ncbi:hypothetical protein SAMN05216267_105531 [Actinacidiphila rubida]|uniref:Secreted protein n=1 Tax=Actinacidiphila rubida TaxID=310780 RepID=A0A1H8TL78_9ACTN|nr:hypothetical protein [Actinacidiphila rubida]SEO91819.1 hypothetical protein SAMN05216267_105531 [Actinacidiphila rubida]